MQKETDLGSAALKDGTEIPVTDEGAISYPQGTRNVEKSHEEALVENQIRRDITDKPERTYDDIHDPYFELERSKYGGRSSIEHAGERYELRSFAERLGKTEKEVRKKTAKDLDAHLEYGLAIINNKREFGEKITLREQTFEELANFAKTHPEIKKGFLDFELTETNDVMHALLFVIPTEVTNVTGETEIIGSTLEFGVSRKSAEHGYITEEWYMAMYIGANTTGTYKKVETYGEATTIIDGKAWGGSTLVEIKRTREQTQEDFKRLQEQLEKVGSLIEQTQGDA